VEPTVSSPSSLSAEEREFVGRMGLFMEMAGGSRIMGLIFGRLMICEPTHQSITELADALLVSKASISVVIRQLEMAQMVERVPVAGSRQHHYRLMAGGWTQILTSRMGRLRPASEAAEYGLSIVPEERTEQREHLYDMRDFLDFIQAEQEYLLERWEEYRKRSRDARGAERHD
jgi:DNA-binding transcriptional regulator GbsR (MarR family)